MFLRRVWRSPPSSSVLVSLSIDIYIHTICVLYRKREIRIFHFTTSPWRRLFSIFSVGFFCEMARCRKKQLSAWVEIRNTFIYPSPLLLLSLLLGKNITTKSSQIRGISFFPKQSISLLFFPRRQLRFCFPSLRKIPTIVMKMNLIL